MEACFEKVVANGGNLTTYVCPHCNNTINTVQPDKKSVTSKGYLIALKDVMNAINLPLLRFTQMA